MRPPTPPQLLLAAAVFGIGALLAPEPARGSAGEWQQNPQSRVRLISPWEVAPREGELILGLEFHTEPGWHVYWRNSGDAGFPPSVSLQPEAILGKPELLWPRPHRYELAGGLVALGYEGEVVYPVLATIRPGSFTGEGQVGDESFRIAADLDYLICKIDCIPYRYTLTLDQKVGFPALDAETRPLLDTWLALLPKTLEQVPGVQVSSVLDASRPEQAEFQLRLQGVEPQPGRTELFLESSEVWDARKARVEPIAGGVLFHVPMNRRDASRPWPANLEIGWTATHLAQGEDRFDLAVRHDVPVSAVAKAPAPAGPARPGKAPLAPHPLARLLLAAFLGGILLNLTPGVLALLVALVTALRDGVRERAAAAAVGVVAMSWAVAGLAFAAHRAGLPAGWGAQLQEPAVAALLAVASTLLALHLWGLAGAERTGRGWHLIAGLVTVLLALAWPVPQLQEPIGYAVGRGPAAVWAVYSALGFGLALPYLILTLAPALGRRLAGSGRRLREGLGFLAAAGTFWVLYALAGQVNPVGLAGIELALLGLSLFAWLRARPGNGGARRFVYAFGLAACGVAALWLADRHRVAPPPAPSTLVDSGSPAEAREPNANPKSGG